MSHCSLFVEIYSFRSFSNYSIESVSAMSFLLEYRKVNDINIPLYFTFSTIIVKDNLTADKLLSLENWTKIFDELNPVLASEPSSSRKSKAFEIDSGRLSVKARWATINDSSGVGASIVKILNLTSVGKYFLKIDIKLSSYLEWIVSELEQKKKSVELNKSESEPCPTSMSGKPIKEKPVSKPKTTRNKSSDSDRTKKVFGSSSDEYSVEEIDAISFRPQKIKIKKERSPKRGMTSGSGKEKEKSKSKKKKLHGVQSSQESTSDVGGIRMRNAMMESVDAILATYTEHEKYLTELYESNVIHLKRSYKPIDIPDMTALDIVSPPQFSAMVDFLVNKLVHNAEQEHNYSDIIFDLLIPEWALAIFRTKHNCSRSQALEKLRLQSLAQINSSDS